MRRHASKLIITFCVLAAFAVSAQAESMMETNASAGKAFMEKNLKADGVKKTASGLQYKIIKEGSGKKPGPTSEVTVNYEGRHLNGEVFDSSYKRNKPISFRLNRVIKGWTEGLQLMKEGAHYQLFIPPELGYGRRGAGAAIGPQETLIFDVELLKVN
ncbi:MAG TPA: FKBP-type peptidyl-prolyl cis-trans isomerase [Gammaproteobacteria bacterium]|nr:FKBP-type peptidyl-prolyl cis-trans isomerase [Gammaproteobacteria bacterium]